MRWIAWLVVAACSGGSGPPAGHGPLPPPLAPPPAEAGPSERECDELITHAVALGIDEKAGAPAPRTTAADHEAVRRQLHEEFMTGCRTLSREAVRCAIAATSLTGLAGCQPSASSSTSNHSVAPGGMTRPAPRSP
ncbi:MAG TPA: hypothetical protein VFT22_09125 [Kofleriaceae bacterium]|nr:hypothetical protein [Kofleriaceae bacterium]